MATHPAWRQHMTFEQYLLLVNNSDRYYEYYDGEVRLMAGGSSNHATISLNFGVALDQALGDKALVQNLLNRLQQKPWINRPVTTKCSNFMV